MAGGPPWFPKEISGLSFFFDGFKNSDEAANYVINHDRGPGTFLLRPSTRCPGTLALTISINRNNARHVNVQQRGDAFFIIPERTFPSFHDLYAHYTFNPINNLEMVNNVKLLNPLDRALLHPTPPLPALPQAAASHPAISPDEIPPLPRKTSVTSMVGRESVRSGNGDAGGGGRHSSSGSQGGLPELPPVDPRRARLSFDSQSNDSPPTSNASSGSGTGPAPAHSPARNSLGASGRTEQAAVQYLAPGSPGSGNMPESMAGAASFASVGGANGVAYTMGGAFHIASKSNPDLFSLHNLQTMPRASEPNLFQLHHSPSASPQSMVLSKKEQKKQQKQADKAEKQKKKDEKKKKKTKREEMQELGWCRPPMPTPESETRPDDDQPYYTSPRPYKNHLEDLKKMLRESEICDCGLRMIDAELVEGWTVHRSREVTTMKRVFYQHENGNTTWVFPHSIANLLSVQQVHFIVRLCRESSQELPPGVLQRYQRIMQVGAEARPQHTAPSLPSSRSDSSSSGTFSSTFSRNASLDKRPPMPGPGGV